LNQNRNNNHALASGDDEAVAMSIVPIAFPWYEHHPHLDVEPHVRALIELFSEFGGYETTWDVRPEERGSDALDSHLRKWGRGASKQNCIIYWVGHGWSDGFDVSLAHAKSPNPVRASGVMPNQLADYIKDRCAFAPHQWTVIIVDTCWSSQFIDKLNASLAGSIPPADSLALVGVSGDGAAALGGFTRALSSCLHDNFRATGTVELWQLMHELDRRLPRALILGRRLGNASLRRSKPVASAISAPLDVVTELEMAVKHLGDDERRHFLAKAQSAEHGELSWFFEGRSTEQRQIVDWLRGAHGGLFIVTGRAGCGKSALLGSVLVHSLPALRNALSLAELILPARPDEQPPANVFDSVIHLAGLGVADVVRRISVDIGLIESVENQQEQPQSLVSELDSVVSLIEARSKPFFLLLDALDESVDPHGIAWTLIGRIAALPNARVIVGSRPSTDEAVDQHGLKRDLIEALTRYIDGERVREMLIDRDDDAVARYVRRRLAAARRRGRLVLAGKAASDEAISRAAEHIAGRRQGFLFARLAAYEIVAEPELLGIARRDDLDRMLSGNHRDVFHQAVRRLGELSNDYRYLLLALAFSRGRGVPIVGGVWALMANALRASSSDVSNSQITDVVVSGLLVAAEPYIAVDRRSGDTVYRLAHRTYVEYFLTNVTG